MTLSLPLELSDAALEAIAQRAAELALVALGEQVKQREWPEYMRPDVAASYMGCARQRVYDLLSAGHLDRYKDGANTLVKRVEIDAYLAGEKLALALPPRRRRRTATGAAA